MRAPTGSAANPAMIGEIHNKTTIIVFMPAFYPEAELLAKSYLDHDNSQLGIE